MIDALLRIIAPHHCYGCGHKGLLLCVSCKNNIIEERFLHCLVCLKLVKNANLCQRHVLPYQRAWVVGWRDEALGQLIDGLKFKRRQSAAKHLADLADLTLPSTSAPLTIVPIPTTAKNIRRRGYDHMLLIAGRIAQLRSWRVEVILRRKNNTTQHFTKSAVERRRQAKDFFDCNGKLSGDQVYLLVDDIFTTGATIAEAAKVLRTAGAKNIWVLILACQRPK